MADNGTHPISGNDYPGDDPTDPTCTRIGDRVKYLIAHDIQARIKSDLPPMIGAFSFVAEYTTEKGTVNFLTLTDGDLLPWQELGLLETRLAILKGRMGMAGYNRYEDGTE